MSGKHTQSEKKNSIIFIILTVILALTASVFACLYFFNPKTITVESEPQIIIADRSINEKPTYEFSKKTDIKYLEMDGALFRPEDPLTHGEMAKMIYALLGTNKVGTSTFADLDESDECFKAASTLKTLGVISGARFHKDEPTTYDELKDVLSYFSIETDGGEEDVTRRRAVEIISANIERNVCEDFDEIGMMLDVSKEDKDYYLIADAALTETLPIKESGYFTTGDVLRLIDEDGCVVVNAEVDGFKFDGNGAQTSGNAEVDKLVRDIIGEVLADTGDHKYHDNDGNLRLNDDAALKLLYDYVIDKSKYVPRNYYEMGDTSWVTDEAYTMLTTWRGNCYDYAAAFYCLARAYGYKAEIYSGTMGPEDSPHSWVEIEYSDGPRLFDPEVESTQSEIEYVSYFKREISFEEKFDYKKEKTN